MALGFMQDAMDSDIQCKCGMTQGACKTNCPLYDEYGEPFDPEQSGMLTLMDKIDHLIGKYKQIPAGKDRNIFRKEVSKLISVCNKRSLEQNKTTLFKTMWY